MCRFLCNFAPNLLIVAIMTAKEYLVDYQIQPTDERVEVVEYLMNHHTHPTGDEIYRGLVRNSSSISRATVFNTLKTLTEHAALHSLIIEDGVTHYDIDLYDHAHFRCTCCGKIYDIPIRRNASFNIPEGFLQTSTDYVISGLCPECASKNNLDL